MLNTDLDVTNININVDTQENGCSDHKIHPAIIYPAMVIFNTAIFFGLNITGYYIGRDLLNKTDTLQPLPQHTEMLSTIKISAAISPAFISVIVAIMYLVEGPKNGFTSIPISMYWAIVTLTTVGYGDLSPSTPFGQFIASIVMILGYGIIAVPTGIVTSAMTRQDLKIHGNTQSCPHCLTDNHLDDAEFCHKCGGKLNDETSITNFDTQRND